ncbi:MAG: copper homeostasis protein CutC, partial [Bacillota bacterium]
VETLDDAIAAETGGAERLDLKADYPNGGVTPTLDTVDKICEAVAIDVMVMVRPRPGDFVYDKHELNAMCKTIARAKKKRVSGFLLGVLKEDGTLNASALKDFIDLAGNKDVHVHLSWEATKDKEEALKKLIDLGVKSVRITGGEGLGEKATDYLETLRYYQGTYGNKIEFVLAGGVDEKNIAPLIMTTHIPHAHVGSGVRTPRSVHGRTDARKVQRLKLQYDLAREKFL